MLPALFLDQLESELWAVYKSLLLFCRGTNSGNPDYEWPTGILVWHGSQVHLWSARSGTLILYRSPYAIHTRKSMSSTVLTMVSSMLTAALAVVDACEKGPIGGCKVWLYCIVLTWCRLETRHWWRSSGVHVIFRWQPGPTIAAM